MRWSGAALAQPNHSTGCLWSEPGRKTQDLACDPHCKCPARMLLANQQSRDVCPPRWGSGDPPTCRCPPIPQHCGRGVQVSTTVPTMRLPHRTSDCQTPRANAESPWSILLRREQPPLFLLDITEISRTHQDKRFVHRSQPWGHIQRRVLSPASTLSALALKGAFSFGWDPPRLLRGVWPVLEPQLSILQASSPSKNVGVCH